MGLTLLTFILLFGESAGLWETEAVSVTGKLDEDVTIECSHFNARSNIKYFCKEPCSNEDVLIRSRGEGTVSKGRYRLIDGGNTFWVIISHLTEDDSGTYRCGIDRWLSDTYNKVILTVIKGDRKATGSDSSGSHSDKNINTNTARPWVLYIRISLCCFVLSLLTAALIFFTCRARRIATPPPETITSTSNEVGDADVRINRSPILLAAHHQDNADDYYSSIDSSSVSQVQPDDLFYSTVSFNKPTECSSVTPRPAEGTCSTIAHIPTDESVVYYNA